MNSTCSGEWALPTSRKAYIVDHSKTRIAQLHENTTMIAPVWSKVSKTPWHEKAKLCGGYGVRIQTSTVSNDAPGHFHSSTKVSNNMEMSTISRSLSANPHSVRSNNKMEATLLLPGGASIFEATRVNSQRSDRAKFLSIPMENRVMMEPIYKKSAREPIDWKSMR
mmetsp:Transcript_27512/g.37816  ORF Transcript_27512/g.37816 Transcript_27512/m.37816 type:complete len:166 (+) Transcript_27512:809-1306(+)